MVWEWGYYSNSWCCPWLQISRSFIRLQWCAAGKFGYLLWILSCESLYFCVSICSNPSCIAQINVYALGRAYLKLSNALHINPPAIGRQFGIPDSLVFFQIECLLCVRAFNSSLLCRPMSLHSSVCPQTRTRGQDAWSFHDSTATGG